MIYIWKCGTWKITIDAKTAEAAQRSFAEIVSQSFPQTSPVDWTPEVAK